MTYLDIAYDVLLMIFAGSIWLPLLVIPLPQLANDLIVLYITKSEKPFIWFQSRALENLVIANIMAGDSAFNLNLLFISLVSIYFTGASGTFASFIMILVTLTDLTQYYYFTFKYPKADKTQIIPQDA